MHCKLINTKYLKKPHGKYSYDNKVMLECDACEKEFETIGGLKQHRLTIHKGQAYLCENCPFEASKSFLIDST